MHHWKPAAALAAVIVLAGFAVPLSAQTAPPRAPTGTADAATALADEETAVTRHTVTVGGRKLDYSAVAGTVTIRDDDGAPTASMFYTAYMAEPNSRRRPITFFYNGGPGSSSMWLHMASFAPRVVALDAPRLSSNAPHDFIDNPATVLDKTDLVFIDAVNTGYSRPLGSATPPDFMSADEDLNAFTRGITRFLTIHGRWNSPKYLFGESYGSARSAGLALRLQQEGAQLNGLIQLGSILDIAKIVAAGDAFYKATFPTYALTAAYHGLIPAPADQAAFRREIEAFVEGPYNIALAKGDALPPEERVAIAERMSRYSGLPVDYLISRNLRVRPDAFRARLLGQQGKVVGELDTRFSGFEVDGEADAASWDPSGAGVFRPIISVFNDYMRNELKYQTPLIYRRAYPGTFEQFDFRRTNGSGYAQFGPDLAKAIKINPRLKVLSMNGVFDLSTVYYGAELDYRHLGLPADLALNITQRYYDAGHMAYVDRAVAQDMARDMRAFFEETAGK